MTMDTAADVALEDSFKSPASRTLHSAAYWDGLERGQIVLQRCGDCGAYTHPPGPLCTACLSPNRTFVPMSGRGTVYTYTVTHRAMHPEFKPDLPYVIVYVKLEEGPMIASWLRGVDPAKDPIIGMPVEAIFERIDARTTLHRFRPATGAPAKT